MKRGKEMIYVRVKKIIKRVMGSGRLYQRRLESDSMKSGLNGNVEERENKKSFFLMLKTKSVPPILANAQVGGK